MVIKRVQVCIKGRTALLMHKFPMVKEEDIQNQSPEKQAEVAAYRDEETQELFIPGVNIQRCLVEAAKYSKGKGRGNLSKVASGTVRVTPADKVFLGTKQFAIDARPVVIKATKGRIIRNRPRIDQWSVRFEIEWDNALISEAKLREIVDNAGTRVGLLDFRPSCNGPFGTFVVAHWEVEEAA